MKSKRSPARGEALWEYLQPLVEFYNLKLDGSENDKEKVKNYLRKHAQQVFSERAKHRTLQWMEGESFQQLRIFWDDMRYLLDSYIDNTLRGCDLVHLKRWLDIFPPTFGFRNRTGEKEKEIAFWGEMWSEHIDPRQWEIVFGDGFFVASHPYRLGPTADLDNWIERIFDYWKFRLAKGMYQVIQKNVRVIRCARCKNIYIPKPRAPTRGEKVPKYCRTCRSKRKS